MRLIGYAYAGRDDDGSAISRQRDQLIQFAAENGHELVGVAAEVGSRNRKGLDCVIEAAFGQDVDGILVVHVDRVARDMPYLLALIHDLGLRGVSLLTVHDHGAVTTGPAYIVAELLRRAGWE